jgi:ribosomal protein S18 acetylase RimI-like enzyme
MTAPTVDARPATRDDLEAVTALYVAYDTAVRGFVDTEPGDVLRDWDEPGFDLSAGTLVLEADGRVVAYAWRSGRETDSVVDLSLRDAGLEDRLLGWLEAFGGPLEHYSPDADPPLGELFARRGWTPARRFWRMRRELDVPGPDPVWPDGVEVHELRRPDDERPVHALVQRCFAEIGGEHERPFEQWAAYLLDGDRFDPALCLVATVDGEVVGVALGEQLPEHGFVRQLAVDRAHRGRGLALALLHESFRRHRERGLPATVLGVDAGNPTGALALYEKAGMRVVEQFTRWELLPAD